MASIPACVPVLHLLTEQRTARWTATEESQMGGGEDAYELLKWGGVPNYGQFSYLCFLKVSMTWHRCSRTCENQNFSFKAFMALLGSSPQCSSII